jgi:glycosyltransferase involved in cell wall biosynthesis
MRVLFVARYLQDINQRKVALLSQYSGVELWHLVPNKWQDTFNQYTAESRDMPTYHQLAHGVRGDPDIHRFFYWPPPDCVRALQPDVLHLEEEPDSLVALEFTLLRAVWAPRSRLVLFTWQNVLRRTRPLVSIITRLNLSQVSGLICGNQAAEQVARYRGYRGPVKVIPQLGVDPADFTPVSREEQRSRHGLHAFTVGFVGRLAPEKGLDLLCAAVEPLEDVQLLLVGHGPLAEALAARARLPTWHGRLRMTGSLTHWETARVLAALDVLVLPSLTRPHWKEQFGHVLIEAMAAGVPVVGSDSGAIPEVIGDAGLVFAEGNAASLRDCLQQLRNDAALRRSLSARGIARVHEHFTHERIAALTCSFYHEVLAKQGHRQSHGPP